MMINYYCMSRSVPIFILPIIQRFQRTSFYGFCRRRVEKLALFTIDFGCTDVQLWLVYLFLSYHEMFSQHTTIEQHYIVFYAQTNLSYHLRRLPAGPGVFFYLLNNNRYTTKYI